MRSPIPRRRCKPSRAVACLSAAKPRPDSIELRPKVEMNGMLRRRDATAAAALASHEPLSATGYTRH